jgi:hypothetical protein
MLTAANIHGQLNCLGQLIPDVESVEKVNLPIIKPYFIELPARGIGIVNLQPA